MFYLGVRTFVNGNEVARPVIDTSTSAEHSIIYRVIDGEGTVLAEAIRTVIVQNPNTSQEEPAAEETSESETSAESEEVAAPEEELIAEEPSAESELPTS